MIEFAAWPKIPRLFRDVEITEKIDGTNAAVHVRRLETLDSSAGAHVVTVEGESWAIAAQSRTRLITPDADNFGFARHVHDNAEGLIALLGEGVHYGEWYGKGIQRGYGLSDKHFALFNPSRYDAIRFDSLAADLNVDVVPVLYAGLFSTEAVSGALYGLRLDGSALVHGFARPEGVVVYHRAAGQTFKALIENDATPKGNVQ